MSKAVGIRELKTHLSRYVKEVKDGDEILVERMIEWCQAWTCDSIKAEHCSHISSVNPHFFSLRKSV